MDLMDYKRVGSDRTGDHSNKPALPVTLFGLLVTVVNSKRLGKGTG
jgi:hypothetical protein